MKRGTASLILGVHQAVWHPITVLLAWRKLYRAWPTWSELIAIALHDVGYSGCAEIDGAEGRQHPHAGAMLAARIVGRIKSWIGSDSVLLGRSRFCIETYFFTLLHSREIARQRGMPVSKLYAPDKYSIFFEPAWWYLLRAKLSGELQEFKTNAINSGHLPPGSSDHAWFSYYRKNVKSRPEISSLLFHIPPCPGTENSLERAADGSLYWKSHSLGEAPGTEGPPGEIDSIKAAAEKRIRVFEDQ